MIILGICLSFQSSACLMIDGKIISASSEERFSGIKDDESYPIKAINYILKSNNIKKKQIDYVSILSNHWTPYYLLVNRFSKLNHIDRKLEEKLYWYPKIYQKNKKVSLLKIFKKKINYSQYPGEKFWKKEIKFYMGQNDDTKNRLLISNGKKIRVEIVKKHLGIPDQKIKFIDHSLGHINFAYYTSDMTKKSLNISIDAYADGINYAAYIFDKKKNKLVQKKIVRSNNSIIARLYRYTTLILNLKPDQHEYKVMGMAPYSKPKYTKILFQKLKQIQNISGTDFKWLKKPKDNYFFFKSFFEDYRFDTIAGALQRYTEYLLVKLFKNLIKKNKVKYINYAGGVAMNVKANMLLSSLKKVNLHVPFAPDDTSQSLGGALALHNQLLSEKKTTIKIQKINSPYLGKNIEKIEIKNFINKVKNNKKYLIYDRDVNKTAAKLLSMNYILGRCVGKAEFGARALGNRSILANPCNLELKQIINDKIKSRDFWMPFAATVLKKKWKRYFYKNQILSTYKYMTNCLETSEIGAKLLRAAIHPADKTCRAQLLEFDDNPSYYELIENFGKKTNNFALLNTSLNFHGYPLANTINDAFNIVSKSNLDGLILDGYLIAKRQIKF
jgi:carbamoyltransferase